MFGDDSIPAIVVVMMYILINESFHPKDTLFRLVM